MQIGRTRQVKLSLEACVEVVCVGFKRVISLWTSSSCFEIFSIFFPVLISKNCGIYEEAKSFECD